MPLKLQFLARNVFDNYLYIAQKHILKKFACLHVRFYPPTEEVCIAYFVHK